MKTVINVNETSTFEIVKHIIYSFQVLIVGIAIPFLFFIGISDVSQKKTQETEVKEITNPIQLSAKPAIELNIHGTRR
jgi:amino acid transporter